MKKEYRITVPCDDSERLTAKLAEFTEIDDMDWFFSSAENSISCWISLSYDELLIIKLSFKTCKILDWGSFTKRYLSVTQNI